MTPAAVEIHAPARDLAGLVAFHQVVEMSASQADWCETLIPAPHYSFIFQYGDGRACRRAGDGYRMYPRHMLAAPAAIPAVVRSTGRMNALRVAMRPHTVELVFRTAASEVRNQVVDIGEFFGREGRDLLDRMAAANDVASRIALFEQWLRARAAGSRSNRFDAMGHVIERLSAHDCALRIRDVAAEMSMGERQLERRFMRCVGLGPKLFQRILRINAVLREAPRSASVDWASLASQFGFADQSHLVRDFVALAGATPAACLREAGVLRAVFQPDTSAPLAVRAFTEESSGIRPAA